MHNFRSEGKTITIEVPRDIESGQGILIGSMFGVACNKRSRGQLVEILVEGVFLLPKDRTVSIAQGDPVYWYQDPNDITRSHCTNDPKRGRLIGYCSSEITPDSPDGVFASRFERSHANGWTEVKLSGTPVPETRNAS